MIGSSITIISQTRLTRERQIILHIEGERDWPLKPERQKRSRKTKDLYPSAVVQEPKKGKWVLKRSRIFTTSPFITAMIFIKPNIVKVARQFNTHLNVWRIIVKFSLCLESSMAKDPAVWVAHIDTNILLCPPPRILDYVTRKPMTCLQHQHCPSCLNRVQASQDIIVPAEITKGSRETSTRKNSHFVLS